MEVRRAADLLRSTASPLTAFLTPANSTRWTARRQLQLRYRHASPCPPQFQRRFTTESRNLAPPPQEKTTASAETQPDSAGTSTTPNGSPTLASTKQKQTEAKETLDINSLSASLWAKPKPSAESKSNPFANSSAADMLTSLNRSINPQYRSAIDISRMQNPSGSNSPSLPHLASNVERELYPTLDFSQMKSLVPEPTPKQAMRLNPSTGRTVPISAAVDVGRAFRMVDISCSRNRVRQDAARQRFYERGGTKRKRLNSERWRKRFKDGFKATIARVQQLRRQGW